jgi:hypothetical protein
MTNETITHASTAAGIRLDRLLAVLPDAIDTAMRETLPARYTPELAREIADRMAAELRANAATGVMPVDDRRTLTYPIKSGGTLTHTCPAWCEYDHTDDVARGINPEDLLHQGDKLSLDYDVDGIEQGVLQARIIQWPFTSCSDETDPCVEFTPEGRTGVSRYLGNRQELEEEINRVRGHLHALEDLAGQLAEAQAAHTSGTVNPRAHVTRTDLLSMPVASLIRVFGVVVQETDEIGDKVTVVLGGEPGGMLLQVHPALPQQAREDETRAALLAWFDSRQNAEATS